MVVLSLSVADNSDRPQKRDPRAVLHRLTSRSWSSGQRIGRRPVGFLLASGATALTVGAAAVGLGAGGAGASTKSLKPTKVIPGPAGLLAATAPQPNGLIWALAGSPAVKTISAVSAATGTVSPKLPSVAISTSASSLVQSSSGLVGVGLSTPTSGAVEFLNGSTGTQVKTVAIGAPPIALTAGSDGSTFYALNGTSASMSVSAIDSITGVVSNTVPAPLDSVAVAVDPTQQRLFVLERSGKVDVESAATGKIEGRFAVGKTPLAMALSSDGSTLYVLKSTRRGDNIGVIKTATEKQVTAMPAAKSSVAVEVSPDNSKVYDVVGSPKYGNIQLFQVPR